MTDTAVKLKALQERFKSETETQYLQALEEALNKILGKLALDNGTIETKRLKSIRKAIESEISQIYARLQAPLKQDIQDFTTLAYTTNATLFGVAFTALPKTLAKKIIDLDRILLMDDRAFTLNELLNNAKANQIKRVKQIMSAGILANDGYRNITKSIKKTIELSQREIRTVVHTSIAHAQDEATQDLEEQFLPLIKGWRSVATLDNRTTLICATLDGKEYLKSKYQKRKSVPDRPPRHFNCRSVLIAFTYDEYIGKRPAKGDERKQVKADTTFKEWFNRQSPTFQEGYLGKARYKLFKEEKLTLNSFVDIKSGKRLTIKEIKALL